MNPVLPSSNNRNNRNNRNTRNNRNNRNNNRNNSDFSNKLSNFGQKLSNAARDVNEKVQTGFQAATNGFGAMRNGINQRVNEAKENISSRAQNQDSFLGKLNLGFEQISGTTQKFAEANSTISKVVFILFMVILFGLLMRLGVFLLSFFMTPSKNPIVVNGMRPTTKGKEYNVNPNEADPKPILRSINEDQGMEFTWSTWFWMEGIDYSDTITKKRIFSKGNNNARQRQNRYNQDNSNPYLMNSPGLYSHADKNSIDVVLNTFNKNDGLTDDLSSIQKVIQIDNIPVQKWVNVIIRIQNNTIDVYLNGTLTKRENLDVVPKQNYGNIYVGDKINGMNGYISSLRYFNHAIGASQIQDILHQGPSLKMEGDDWNSAQPPYLAMRWYFDQEQT